ncbi:hypothetical protein RJP21_18655 [Paenibacillus sp. VCA1]|uniref:hypothetical protein n=1 Tax=Paenibacillus sp. VCA1 TaxID=3039148 RepID=UPI0028710886|nr:hypothetical protein [Paenibacillus sp. VCA1]MDR9855637.1 hypothetical protein [Paenibacillus sp. VCA1]
MDFTAITALISVCGVISGIIIEWSGRNRGAKHASKRKRGRMLQCARISNISKGIEDIKYEQRTQGKRFDELTERVTRVEESAKQAHKRFEELKHQRGGANLGQDKIQD